MAGISVVINTLNEEENLPRALASVKNFADEVVVCDMHSYDRTVEISNKAGARVYQHERTGYVEPARNYAIEKAKSDWILILDADEELPKSLAKKLSKIASGKVGDPIASRKIRHSRMTSKIHLAGVHSATSEVKERDADYYRLPRKNVIFGKWIKHSHWWPDYNIRFFKKGHVSWSEEIHSVPVTTGKGLDLPAKEENALLHNHYSSIEQYIQRLNRYTSIQANDLKEKGYEFIWHDLVKKPVNEFLSRYFQGEGYKDGIHGLALAGLQSFSQLVLYLKVWELTKFKDKSLDVKEVVKQMKTAEKDLHFWQADTLVKEHGGLMNIFRRRLKI